MNHYSLTLVLMICFLGCDVHVSTKRALRAKDVVEIKRLLLVLEKYSSVKKQLPSGLEELKAFDHAIHDIDVSAYRYDSKGFLTADGAHWLISIRDPTHTGRLIVGRLPLEISFEDFVN